MATTIDRERFFIAMSEEEFRLLLKLLGRLDRRICVDELKLTEEEERKVYQLYRSL